MDSTTISILMTTTALALGPFQAHFFWVLVVGFVLSFLLGFGMGANDVANAFGTSVGSKVLSVRAAYVLATVMETAGAILLGYNVADTMRKGVVDVGLYADQPEVLMMGQLAILGGGATWLFMATILRLPVSTTHSIVGATLGFSLMVKGTQGIQWRKIIEIAASWVISPVFSGLVSTIIYLFVDFAVLRRRDPLECGYRVLPFFFFVVFAINAVAVLYDGSKVLGLAGMSRSMTAICSLGVGVLAALVAQFLLKPWLRKWVERKESPEKTPPCPVAVIVQSQSLDSSGEGGLGMRTGVPSSSTEPIVNVRAQKFEWTVSGFFNWLIPARDRLEDARTLRMFSSLQIFTACFAGFAHGANDVSNAIAPLAALLSIYSDLNVLQTAPTPIYILFFGTGAVCVGLWVLGHRVIKTIGDRVTEVNPASGFVIEFGAAVTAMLASKLGLPISTTHALVGSVVGVGLVKSGEGVDWKVFLNIALSWCITLPVSGLISAGIIYALMYTL